jgi:LPXTG-site transpeptidase (sortase) family protein
MKRALFYIEKIFLLGGIGLILVFLAVKIHAQQGHSASVNEAESLIQSNKKVHTHAASKTKKIAIKASAKQIKAGDILMHPAEQGATEKLPDMSDWSSKRKKDYDEAEVNSPILGLLEIPQIELKVAIFDKASEPHLNKGVARVLQRAKLSGEGNLSLAGHRDGFFRKLGQVVLGDVFTVKDISGNEFNYQVTKTWIVKPKDTYVMKATEKPSITLITCYPFYFVGSAPERYIVRAERI